MSIRRELVSYLPKMLDKFPVIALTGPRQAGKTTFLKALLHDYTYVSLENLDNRDFAQNDPNGFLKRYDSKVIIDEAQRVPQIFSYIQTKVDESGIMGQYILSGSQNFHLLHEITQSLAGRVAIFRLFPFDIQEMATAGLLKEDYLENIFNGFYPAIYDRDILPKKYYKNYVQTYLQRDVSELIEIRHQSSFKKFLGIIATRAGQLLNLNAIANICGISQPTAKAWLSALENSYVVFMLPPYFENFGKRLIKSPKLYFYDTGLLCHLLGIHEPEELYTNTLKGALFENFVVAEHIKRMYHTDNEKNLWFWRDSKGHEVDLLYKEKGKMVIAEIKANQTILTNQFKGLRFFEEASKKENLEKQLIYAGTENQVRTIGKVISWMNISN